VNVVAVNLALDKTAVQISTYRSPGSAAVDGILESWSCTHSEPYPWWAVDLGEDYNVGDVNITSPASVDRGNDLRFCFIH